MGEPSENRILELLSQYMTFETHPLDDRLQVSKWGSIIETRRFLEFAKAILAENKKSEIDMLKEILDMCKVSYGSYEFKKLRYVVPKGAVRKIFEDRGEKCEFVFDSNGKFIEFKIERKDDG